MYCIFVNVLTKLISKAKVCHTYSNGTIEEQYITLQVNYLSIQKTRLLLNQCTDLIIKLLLTTEQAKGLRQQKALALSVVYI